MDDIKASPEPKNCPQHVLQKPIRRIMEPPAARSRYLFRTNVTRDQICSYIMLHPFQYYLCERANGQTTACVLQYCWFNRDWRGKVQAANFVWVTKTKLCSIFCVHTKRGRKCGPYCPTTQPTTYQFAENQNQLAHSTLGHHEISNDVFPLMISWLATGYWLVGVGQPMLVTTSKASDAVSVGESEAERSTREDASQSL